jgi:uncharacterized protein YkwD
MMMNKRVLFILVLGCLALPACGGEGEAERGANEIGRAEFATNAPPTGVDLEDQETGPGGVVSGEPRLELEPDEPPAEELGAERAVCSGTTLVPSATNVAAVSSATLCLLNAERAARGMKPLRANQLLRKAAAGHAVDMVRKVYFAHDSLDGRNFATRIERAGYLRGANNYTIGENLGWAATDADTPRTMVELWMASPGHRANILQPKFREIGIAVTRGVPTKDADSGSTYVTEFGARW